MTIIRLLSPPLTADKWLTFLAFAIHVVIAFTIHEYAHALSATSYGDDTAQRAGRLTLDPRVHLDAVGTAMIFVFGFGWAKPTPFNARRMRNPRLDALRVALWGPFSNLLLAVGMAAILRFVPILPSLAVTFLLTGVYWNALLAIFNLLPLPPLDGSRIITYLLPPQAADSYARFFNRYGLIVIILVIIMGQGIIGSVIGNAAGSLTTVLIGAGDRNSAS